MYKKYDKIKVLFEWNDAKSEMNHEKHGISFDEARQAFLDSNRVIAEDLEHSSSHEKRYYCFGKVDGIMTVRFTFRDGVIRIIGAGYWRKGKKIYEEAQKNKVH